MTEAIVIDNPIVGVYAREILSLLSPMDVVGDRLVRVGRDFDGGYIMLENDLEGKAAYSFGISDDVSWDLDIVRRGGEVYCYDHTIDALPVEHPKLHWERAGLAARANEESSLKTLDDIITSNRHENNDGLILKMDIEGFEWEVFENLDYAILQQFSQMVVEIHWLRHIDDVNHCRRFRKVLSKLNRTHQVIHVHGNNCGPIVIAGGVCIPDTFEVTYARRDLFHFKRNLHVFPTPLDQPNNHIKGDIFLGALGLLSDEKVDELLDNHEDQDILAAKLSRVRWELDRRGQQLLEIERKLEAVYASRSWKITRPLRLMSHAFRMTFGQK